MRPLLIHSYSGRLGGSERILLDLLHRLREPVVLACPPGPLADGAASADVPVLRLTEGQLEARGPVDAAKSARAIVRHGREVSGLVRDLDPAQVVSWGMRSAMASVAALRPLRGLGRNADIRLIAEHVDLLPEGVQGRLARAALLRCDRVICLSEAIASDLIPSWRESESIRVVHPGVRLPELDTDMRAPDTPTALILAAIEPWKGHDTALDAVASIPDLRLVIAGSPLSERGSRFEAKLRERAALPDLNGRVDFVGTVDPHEALAASTLLLHPAPAEPFGMAMAEALAAGRPVVASKAAGALEIVSDECGRLATAGDPRSFALAMQEVLTAPGTSSALGSAGRERAAAMFDPQSKFLEWKSSLAGNESGDPESHRGSKAGADLSIVTVIHNSAPDLSRLLASISRHLPATEVIVVDSGSSDAGPAIASQWAGHAKVLALDGNLGFGAGCVLGMGVATRSVTGLVNPDVEFVDSSLAGIAAALADPATPERLVCPSLIHPDGRRQDAVHPVPAAAGDIIRAVIPAPLLPRPLARIAEPHRMDRAGRVGWAVAACLIGRTKTLMDLGPFDPAVHLYAEDLDLCLRAAEKGIETWFDPSARAVHREAHASQKVFGGEPSLLLAERRRAVIRERLGDHRLRRDDAVQMVTHINRLALKTVLGRDTSLERQRIAALRTAKGAAP